MIVVEWTDTYGIHHWRILWSSYRKLAWVGFEPTTTQFRSDALTDWAIRPWVQLVLRANFAQLLQLHCSVSGFISAIALASCHILFLFLLIPLWQTYISDTLNISLNTSLCLTNKFALLIWKVLRRQMLDRKCK